jgi:hypothetical protein
MEAQTALIQPPPPKDFMLYGRSLVHLITQPELQMDFFHAKNLILKLQIPDQRQYQPVCILSLMRLFRRLRRPSQRRSIRSL